jgi:hypothetical protein
MRLATLTIGAVAALAAPTTGLGAVAAVQDDYLPITPLPQLEHRLDLVQSTGARVARVDVFWSDVAPRRPARPADPNDPAYRFDLVDATIGGLLDRGIRPIVSVYSTPRWAAGRAAPRGQHTNPWLPQRPADFGAFMQALATRYSGTAATPLYGRRLEVRHYEIWNECNLQLYCRPQYRGRAAVSPRLYANLVRAAYPRIKRANPRAIVIAGATGPKSRSDQTGIGTMDWLAALRRSGARFDAYSQHIYPAAPPRAQVRAVPSWNSVPLLLREVDKIRRGMPMYITEAGYTTRATPFRRVRVTERQQSTYLKQIFALTSLRSPRIPVVVWFNLQDNRNWPGGLLRANGTPKPSFSAFRSIAQRGRVPASLRP